MRLLLLTLLTAVNAFAETRVAEVAGWWVPVPADTKLLRKDGPDFTVSYFEFPSLKGRMGIYVGNWPSRFAEKAKGVKEMKDVICGQPTKWSVWLQNEQGTESVHAETIVRPRIIRPGEPNQPSDLLFHIFVNAPDHPTRVKLQMIARSLTRERPTDAKELAEEHPHLSDPAKLPHDQEVAARAIIAAVRNAGLDPSEYGVEVSHGGGKLRFWLIHDSHKPDPGMRGDSCGKCRTIVYDSATGEVSRLFGIK